jgi:hypothetical protein
MAYVHTSMLLASMVLFILKVVQNFQFEKVLILQS